MPTPTWFVTGSALSLALLTGGLAASFFHLAARARLALGDAVAHSWLSREVIALPAFMLAVAGTAHCTPLDGGAGVDDRPGTGDLGIAGGRRARTLLAFALFACTGMIYASFRSSPSGARHRRR